jgi:PAS domain S-box-containing protein
VRRRRDRDGAAVHPVPKDSRDPRAAIAAARAAHFVTSKNPEARLRGTRASHGPPGAGSAWPLLYSPDLVAQATHAAFQRHASLLDCLAEGAVVVDGHGQVVLYNAAVSRGLRERVAAGSEATPLAPVIARALHGDRVEPVELVITGEAATFHVRASATPLRDDAGAVVGALVLLVELAPRRREPLTGPEGSYRALIDTIPQIAWMAAPGGQVNFVNARWAAYTGLAGDTPPASAWDLALHPDEREAVFAGYFAAIAEGQPFELHCRLRRADGLYRWHLCRGVPIRDATGQLRVWSGTATDIEDARHADRERAALVAREQAAGQQLEVSEARYRSLVLATSQMVWATSAAGEVIEDSPSWRSFTGQSYEAWSGAGWLDAVHPDDRAATAEAWGRALADCVPYDVEYRLRRHDGEYRTMLARAAPVRGADGVVREWIGVNTDISERKEDEAHRAQLLVREQAARAEAEAANRLKDEFLATLSHELRTPLSGILGWATMLRRGRQGDPKAVERGVEVIERNARAQQRIIEDMLDMSRIVRGELRIETESVELAALAEDVLATVRPSAEAKGIDLRCDAAGGPFRVVGDPMRLRQVLWNLLCNAIKFTPEDGAVALSLRRVDGDVEINVRDSGCGIAPEFLPHVFERFRQADSSTTRLHGGLGLGLAIVRYLVEMHGGSAQVASDGPGRGALFTVTIPARAAHRPVTLIPDAPADPLPGLVEAPGEQRLVGARILLVEDEVDTREFLELLLRGAGAEVRSVGSAEAALDALADFPSDLLVSDLGMPGRDGLWLVGQARARRPDLPTVALTAFAGADDAERARAAGFDRYLVKPVDPERLLAVVADARGLRP